MKQRIPADVERLMWLVAESHDPNAIADFEARFPELKGELAQRRRMVADLKGAKGASASIPVFQPRPTTHASGTKQIVIGGAFALAALAAASYSVTKWLLTPVPKPPPPPVVNTYTPPSTSPTIVYKTPKQDNPAPVNQNPPPNNPPTTSTTQSNVEQPKTVKMANTSLVAALKMIGAESGYNVEIAPGFKDQKVSLDYESQTASSILKDLGLRYQFTAFDQGDGTIIIVPAVDHGGPTGDTNGSDRQLGG